MWQDVWQVTLMGCQKKVGADFTLLQRIYVCNYGNVTVNYTNSMKQQDGMNYWYTTAL